MSMIFYENNRVLFFYFSINLIRFKMNLIRLIISLKAWPSQSIVSNMKTQVFLECICFYDNFKFLNRSQK